MNLNWLSKAGAIAVLSILLTGCLGQPAERKNNDYLDDKVIAARVSQKLNRQQGNPFADVNVTVTNGVVELSGTVKSPEQKAQAAELARDAGAATDVRNGISIKP